MRILKLKFANINSLKGTWEINFQNNAFQSTGIFAITGKTGSGKTSILDAICLALYDQTPRVSNPTKGEFTSNEVMNWDSTECFSELVFEVKGEQYRAYWKQKKTRRKSKESDVGDKLGDPQVGLDERSKDGSWKNIADKKLRKKEMVEKLLGMGFNQFTRSVLLAQGSFSTFLKSDKNLRADTLEKITGTQIYSEISAKVFKKSKEVDEKYKEQQIKIDSLQTLPAEQRQEFEKQQLSLAEILSQSKGELEKLTTQKQWLESIQKQSSELEAKQNEYDQSEKQLGVYAEKQQKAERATNAAKIEPLYASLQQDRAASDDLKKQLEENEIKRDYLSKQIIDKSQVIQKTQLEAVEAEAKHKELLKTIGEVVPLDSLISDSRKTLGEKTKILSNSEKTGRDKQSQFDSENQKHRNLQIKVGKLQKEVSSLQRWKLSEDKIFELKKLIDENKTSAAQLTEQTLQSQTLQNQLTELNKRFAEIDTKQTQIKLRQTKVNDKLAIARKNLNSLLGGKDLATFFVDCQKIKSEFKDCKSLLEKTQEYASEKESFQVEEKEINKDLDKLNAENEVIEAKKKERESIKENMIDVDKLIKIHDLIAERQNLEEGQPCPLCGSLNHPFAEKLPEDLKDAQTKKKKLESKLKNLDDEIDCLVRKAVKTSGSLETQKRTLAERKEKLDKQVDKLIKKNLSLLNEVADLPLDKIANYLGTKCVELEEHLLKTAQAEKEANSHATSIEDLSSKLEELNKQLEGNQKDSSKITSEIDRLTGKLETTKSELEKTENEIKKIYARACDQYSSFLEDVPNETTIWDSLKKLLKKAKNLDSKQEQLEKVQQDEQILAQRLEGMSQTLELVSKDISEKAKELETVKNSLTSLEDKREVLFGNKDPKSEEDKSQKHLDSIKDFLEKTKKEVNALNDEKLQKTTLIEEVTRQFNVLQESLKRKTEEWKQALREFSFVDERDWAHSKLTEAQIANLRKEVTDYEQMLHALNKAVSDAKEKLTETQGQALTNKTIEEVSSLVSETSDRIEKNFTELGELKEKIQADNAKFQEKTILEKDLSTIGREKQIWNHLNELVGSSKGDKYKVFVQSLLLKTLVQKANQELSKITDRYVLLAGGEDLDIKLIDRDLAGQERTSNNLSGGETFIVSLALALGLSKMASRNVRIDSLFLDEGFGTLDQESLERALSALGHLNSQGKIVGIISHVPLIQERMPVKINVFPDGNGRSRIEGPGVTRLSE